MSAKPRLVFIMGPTNVGKGRLLAEAGKVPHVGLVEVGKCFRRKYFDPASKFYDPDHFKGQGAPQHTQKEAWDFMLEGIAQAEAEKKEIVFIDGQPRDISQAKECALGLLDYPDKRFIALYASHETRLARAVERDGKDMREDVRKEVLAGTADAEDLRQYPALRLSVQRMVTDYRALYEVLSTLSSCGRVVFAHRTDEIPGYNPYPALVRHLTESKRIPGQMSLFDE